MQARGRALQTQPRRRARPCRHHRRWPQPRHRLAAVSEPAAPVTATAESAAAWRPAGERQTAASATPRGVVPRQPGSPTRSRGQCHQRGPAATLWPVRAVLWPGPSKDGSAETKARRDGPGDLVPFGPEPLRHEGLKLVQRPRSVAGERRSGPSLERLRRDRFCRDRFCRDGVCRARQCRDGLCPVRHARRGRCRHWLRRGRFRRSRPRRGSRPLRDLSRQRGPRSGVGG